MKKTLKVLIPILIAAVLLAWIYRDFDFSSFGQSLLSMDWGWMAASLVAGAMSYVIRGIRWRLLLEPMGVRATDALCINSVNVAYMMNIVIPRIGEVSRCAILRRYDGVPFPKSLGTIVTERVIDLVCIALITLLALSVVLTGTWLMMVFEPQLRLVDALFEMTSAFGTVGLSTGITTGLGIPAKLISILTMYIGRLGPLTIASVWYFDKGERISYPEGNIAIG